MSVYIKLLPSTGCCPCRRRRNLGRLVANDNIRFFIPSSNRKYSTGGGGGGAAGDRSSAGDNTGTTIYNNNNNYNELSPPSLLENRQIFPFEKMPTATRLPFIGTKLDFLLSGSGRMLHKYIDDRHRQLGRIFREPLGPIDGVFISEPSMMREVFRYEGKYPKHPLPDAWLLYNEIHQCKRGLFFMENDEWLENRKIMNKLLMRNDDFQLAREAIERNSTKLINEWMNLVDCNNNNPFIEIPHLINALYRWSINAIVEIMLSEKVIESNDKLQKLIETFIETVHQVFEHSAPLMSISPQFARKYHLKVWQTFEQTVTENLRLANAIIDAALDCQDPSKYQQQQQYTSKTDGLILEMLTQGMSVENVKRIFIDLIMAAGDTTAFTMQWALYLLAKNTLQQIEVRDDILTHSNTMECALVRGAIKETFRLYPVATFIGRIIEKDAIVGNYSIPKYTPLLLSLYTSGRDENNFQNATNFLPSRWSRSQNGVERKTNENRKNFILPYAMGVRSCIGQKIANQQMHILMTEILKKFELHLLNKKNVEIIMKMVAVPNQDIRIGIRKI